LNFKGGLKEAARMLSGLGPEEREKVLEIIAKKDPAMAERLRKNMVTLEDLKFLTVKMIQELLREIDIQDFALTLRIASPELRDHILSNVSSSMRSDIEQVLLGPPQSVSKVQEKTEEVLKIVREKMDRGELIINRNSDDEYV
jgi:flagellar motor switch protein FliG